MKILIGTLCFCLGGYFASYSGRLIILRHSGNTAFFQLLDGVTGCLPFISIALLLLIGVIALLKSAIGQPQSIFLKSLLTLVIALVPFGVHMAMYKLTYSAGPIPAPKMLGALSVSEWLILLLGFVLAAVGFSLFLRTRNR